ncbi:MAG: cellulase family glycosylhydrolase [Lentisphaerota bacterium]
MKHHQPTSKAHAYKIQIGLWGLASLLILIQASCVSPPPVEKQPAAPLSFLHTEGMKIVNAQGEPVQLRGCNAGGWLLIEPWMIGLSEELPLKSEKDLWDLFTQRFGAEATRGLIKTYRDHFFTEDDVRRIAESGMNCIRLPIWWRAVSEPPYDGGMEYIDRFVDWCERYGVYAILDLHGAPGTQSDKAIIMGEPADSGLWKKKANKEQAVAWWRELALRYKDRPAVAGYDLLNEAFTAPFDDMISLYDEMYRAIRKTGSQQLVIMEDGLIGYHRMPKPADKGWENVAYSFHYYPQSGEESFMAAGRIMPRFSRTALSYGVPTYVGEFNTFLYDRGGAETFRRYIEVFDYYGWPWTFWNWKKIENNWDNSWGMVGYYASAPVIDPLKDSQEAIRAAFEAIATDQSIENPLLRAAIMAPNRWVKESTEVQLQADDMLMTLKDAVLTPKENGTIRMEWGPARPNAGYWSKGENISWDISVTKEAVYELVIRMANTGDKNRVGVWVDGVRRLDSPVQNTTGWQNYQDRSLGHLSLSAGRHVITLNESDDEKSFINLQLAFLCVAPDAKPQEALEDQMQFSAVNMTLRSNSPVRVEWVNDPPNIGFWVPGERITWPVELERGGTYRPTITYATPDKDTTMNLLIDGKPVQSQSLGATGTWQTYKTVDLGEVKLEPGCHVVSLVWDARHQGSTGNFRELVLDRRTRE